MSRIIDDFINSGSSYSGIGFFEGDNVATELSRTMSKNQKRGYKRRKEVPAAFFLYLGKIGVISCDIPKQGECRSIHALREFLHDNSNYPDAKAFNAGQYLRKCLLKEALPMLRKSFGESSSIWKAR